MFVKSELLLQLSKAQLTAHLCVCLCQECWCAVLSICGPDCESQTDTASATMHCGAQ
jgi:hypothetical protein